MAIPPRVAQIAGAVFGPETDLCAAVSATQGRVAETYLLTLSDEPRRAVCKIGGPSVRTGDVIEPLVVDLVQTTTALPAPAVLATGTVGGCRWAVYEFCGGESPAYRTLEPTDREQITRQVGTVLGQLHTTHQFDRIGGLARADDRLVVTTPFRPWLPEAVRRLLPTGREYEPVLCHGDLFPGNLLAEGGQLTGVLDWGNAHVSTPGYALARAEMRFVDWFRFSAAERDRLRGTLRAGYREHRPLPPAYETVAGIWKATWLGQSAGRLARHVRTRRGRRQLRRHAGSLVGG